MKKVVLKRHVNFSIMHTFPFINNNPHASIMNSIDGLKEFVIFVFIITSNTGDKFS